MFIRLFHSEQKYMMNIRRNVNKNLESVILMKNTSYKVYEKTWDGVMYPVIHQKNKVVITMSGSEGGLTYAKKLALFFQDHGICSLALGLFKTKHTQRYLSKIPLERIHDAIIWLQEKGYRNIAVEGLSKSTEYALAAAIEFHQISCVILKTPSWFYSEGLIAKKPSQTSCWTLHGKDLPYTPYKIRNFKILKMFLKTKDYNILELNSNKTIRMESQIPIEQIKAPILMFSTSFDTIWPSQDSCKKLMKRLETQHYPYPFYHVCFHHMSHIMVEYCSSKIKWFFKSERNYKKECFRERKEMGTICIDWINHIWESTDTYQK